ncbi:peptidase inhibitor family I36 protein [Streptomyces caeruleatus]|uniref:Peptidase inhibitor n=1 Tax=Streptomyces caeruleatus TaxID=661399 RepID=A0A101TUZ5_9ACTN|nr:peptidase inhibitor family I36 protein [Streptomyces caeruleatus]KUN98973.1 hypothetical protein AQJ67_26765 [Streptomyces caeruleatus]
MRKFGGTRAKAVIAAGAMLLGGLGVAATASPAQAALSDCDPGSLCAYVGTHYAGTPGQVKGDNKDLLQYDKFKKAKSVFNRGTSCDVRLYVKKDFQGASFLLARGKSVPDLSTFQGGKFKNGIASNKWVC